jgi:hypothetical protein
MLNYFLEISFIMHISVNVFEELLQEELHIIKFCLKFKRLD